MKLPTERQWVLYSALCARLQPLPAPERMAALQGLRATGAEDPQILSLVAVHFALPPDPDRLRTGERLGNYTLEEPLGAGGMGVVYHAQQHLGTATRPVAVKLIHPALLRTAREEALARFLAELHTLVMLQHEGIARIYDGGIHEDPRTHDQIPYLAMELVGGGLPLTTYAEDYALTWQERLALFLRVCRAVQYAHEHRVVHRDLKPANILVDSDGRPVVIDFGLAQACDAVLPGAHLAASGTPAYMSPEQVSDAFGAVSAKSDVYALGLILYELLTAQLPYTLPRGGSVAQWCQAMTEASPPSLRQYHAVYRGELEAIMAAALAKRPADRPSVAVLRSRLVRYLWPGHYTEYQTLPSERGRPRHDTHQAPPDLQAGSPPPAIQPAPSTALPPAAGTSRGPGTARHDRPEAERRQLTVLFCDLVGSTALSGQLDPEDLREVLRAYLETCTEVIARFGGNIDKFLGDGALVCFGYPQAHEDDPQRAVRAGLGIVEAMARVNTRLAQTWGVQLAVRIGIHTGLVVAGELRVGATRELQAIVGETPNIAARLQELAAPNTVVCSATTARLVDGYFTLEALGLQGLKGVAMPVPVYRVVGESMAQTRLDVAATRGLTPLVGREPEGALLRERWAQVKDGRGQVVVLSGEAGIGKSRLVQAFTAHMSGEASTQIVYHCSPYYQHSAFYPVVEHLQRLLQFRPDEAPAEQLRKLEAALGPYDFPLEEVVPLVAALLGLPLPERYPPLTLTPERQKQQQLETLLAWLLKEAERQPVCVVTEDLHWGDPSTLEWLSLLVAQIPTARVLLLLLCRPEFQPPWAGRSYLTPLALSRLSNRQTAEMIGQVAGGKLLPAEVVQQVVTTTDGVPLFVEELTKMVLEAGLVTEREGQYDLTGPLPPLAIPATLHDALMARLDHLGPAKQVAQLGAVVGREFAYAVLQAVAPLEEGVLQQGLAQLVAAELLYQRGLPPQAWYRFKHALIQEAAYQSLLKRTRRQYHQQIAEVLEAQFPETCELHPELVAHHALQGEIWEKAVAYFRQVGARAYDRAAFHEAVASFDQALQALEHLPEDGDTRVLAIELRLALGEALTQLGELRRHLALLGEAEALASALDDRPRLGRVLVWKTFVLWLTGDPNGALAAGQKALALAAALGDSALQVEAALRLGQAYQVIGDFGQAAALLRRNVEATDWASGPLRANGRIISQAWLALTLSALGAFAEGRRHGEEALRCATREGRGSAALLAHYCLGYLYLAHGDLEHAIRVLEQGLALCRASGSQTNVRPSAAFLGYAYALQGRLAEGRALLEEAISISLRSGVLVGHAIWLAWLSEVCRLMGHCDEAGQHARQALDLARQQKARGNEACALHQLGVVHAHAAPPDVAQAEASYQQALALADELGMRPLQAHCHRGLGTLYAATGQREQARAALATAIDLYRAMEMTFWLPQAEATLAQMA